MSHWSKVSPVESSKSIFRQSLLFWHFQNGSGRFLKHKQNHVPAGLSACTMSQFLIRDPEEISLIQIRIDLDVKLYEKVRFL